MMRLSHRSLQGAILRAALVLFAALFVAAPSEVRGGGCEGEYDLHFSQDRGWHRNQIIIESVDAEAVKGRVVIDLGIGPEARAPMPDERAWTLPFTAKRSAKSERLAFSVTVGERSPVEYSFTLFFIDSAPGYLAGTVALRTSTAPGAEAAPRVMGALARRTSTK